MTFGEFLCAKLNVIEASLRDHLLAEKETYKIKDYGQRSKFFAPFYNHYVNITYLDVSVNSYSNTLLLLFVFQFILFLKNERKHSFTLPAFFVRSYQKKKS